MREERDVYNVVPQAMEAKVHASTDRVCRAKLHLNKTRADHG
jgi:hypothetical protein